MATMRIALLLVAALYVQGCAGIYVEDWNLRYKNCKAHEEYDAPAVTCEWQHTLLGS